MRRLIRVVGQNSLNRATGGAQWHGEHTRSFMNNDGYTPDAKTNTKAGDQSQLRGK